MLRVVIVVVTVVLTLYLIYLLRQPLTWIFIAGFLAVALSGPVNVLARYMKRGFAIAIVYLTLILIPFLLGALLIPPVVEQLNNLIDNLPRYVDDLQEFVQENERLRQIEADYNITAELEQQARTLPSRFGDAAGILSDIGLGLVNSVFAGVSILVLSLFMIGSGRNWLHWLATRQGPDRERRCSTACSTGSATRSATTSPARWARRPWPASSRTSCCGSSVCPSPARSP